MTRDDGKAVGKAGETRPAGSTARSKPGEIDRFLSAAKQLAPLATGRRGGWSSRSMRR
jgi:hypothetical protein